MPEILTLGIDIGGTNTRFGLVDRKGAILHRGVLSTNDYAEPEAFVKAVRAAVAEMPLSSGVARQINGIGIGAPNGNYYTGNIEFAVNLRWKGLVPLAGMFAEAFGIPCRLTNDANAAATGEMIFGAARGMRHFILITLGTGLGSGIVIEGKVVYGHDGNAGELGHIIAVPGGRPCGCGRKGCLETYVSATGIVNTVKELLSESAQPSLLRKIPADALTSRKIYDAAKDHDHLALHAFDITTQMLGLHLANAVAFSSPEAIILLGGLAQAREFMIGDVKTFMERNLLKIYQNKVSILPSQLPEDDAAILGAAALVWEHGHPEQ